MRLGRSLRRGGLTALLAVLLLAFAVPTIALARVTVPPGSTEGDQYFEEAPNGGGSSSIDNGGGGSAGGSGPTAPSVPVAGTAKLKQLGPDGKAAAALANANRPPEHLKAHPI